MKNEYVSVDDALQTMLASVVPLGREEVNLLESLDRILFEDIISPINIPPFDNSAMDGYAVISADCLAATRDMPVTLPIVGEIKAGDDYREQLKHGTALRIMTGAPVPGGCDAVIQVEDTSESDGSVQIHRPVSPDENIRHAGEDIAESQAVLLRGDALKSADIGLLASLNFSRVPVYRRPRIAIISTGDELAEVGAPISRGMIRNSNAYSLYCESARYNAEPAYLGIVRDNPDDTLKKLNEALQYDIVLTTGGVSMGKYDYVKDSLDRLGASLKTVKIRMKPGKPLVFGTQGKTLFFGLPGNPVSAMISFLVFVRPVILRMMGARSIEKPLMKAIVREPLKFKPDRTHFFRGYYSIEDESIMVSATGPQGSGILKSMSAANCLILIPEGSAPVMAGDRVSIMLIDHRETR